MSQSLEGCRELSSSFSLTRSERGIVAQRIFVYQPTDKTYTADLPDIGDVFEYPPSLPLSLDFYDAPGLICKSREETVVNSDANTIQFVCHYNNEPCDITQFAVDGEESEPADVSNLPITMEYSGEFVNVKSVSLSESKWKWQDNGEPVLDPICFKVVLITMRLKRFVSDSYYDIFMANCRDIEGHVNQGDNPLPGGGGTGCWLFNSVNTEMYRNYDDKKIWQAELLFSYRDPDNTDLEGWNKILRRDGTWQIPVLASDPTVMIYPAADFNYLFKNEPYSE